MILRRVLPVLLAAFCSLPIVAAITPGDAAALRAVIDDHFPGRKGTIVVYDSIDASTFTEKNVISLRDVNLGANVVLSSESFPVDMIRKSPRAIAAFNFHPIHGEANWIDVNYALAMPDGKLIRSGHGAMRLAPRGKEWTITQRNESLIGFDPKDDPHALRVGGDVRPPVKISGPEPVVTDEARNARIAGIVIMELTIDEQGNVIGASVLKPLPFGLDKSALDAVAQSRYQPGTLNGRPVPVILNMTVQFKPSSLAQ